MKVLLFLLLALATPAVKHAKSAGAPPEEVQRFAVERDAAKAERDTANWTKALTIWTGAMATATFSAVVVPLGLRWKDRREATNAAMRDLYQIASVFKSRADKLAADPKFDGAALLEGLDVLLARALSDDIARALPNTTDTSYVYHAMFTSYDTMSDAIHYQNPMTRNHDRIQHMAVASSVMLKRCLEALEDELKERKAQWKPSPIGTWVGTESARQQNEYRNVNDDRR